MALDLPNSHYSTFIDMYAKLDNIFVSLDILFFSEKDHYVNLKQNTMAIYFWVQLFGEISVIAKSVTRNSSVPRVATMEI